MVDWTRLVCQSYKSSLNQIKDGGSRISNYQ